MHIKEIQQLPDNEEELYKNFSFAIKIARRYRDNEIANLFRGKRLATLDLSVNF